MSPCLAICTLMRWRIEFIIFTANAGLVGWIRTIAKRTFTTTSVRAEISMRQSRVNEHDCSHSGAESREEEHAK